MKLLIGLGNPGKRYEKTRHNVGFMLLDHIAEKYQGSRWRTNKKFNALTTEVQIGGEKYILGKPLTYMNSSGQSVGLLMNFYKIGLEDLTIIHDEKDLPLGEYKIQKDRGHAGHNGIKSIINTVGSKNFTRVRVGVASSNEKKMADTAKFVLGKFGIFERKKLKDIYDDILQELFG